MDLPRAVAALVYLHGALVTGSQAERYAAGEGPDPDRDWDLLVPFGAWREAASRIPRTARPNGNRGWRFATKDGAQVDVWPDELARFFGEATSPTRVRAKPGRPAYAVDVRAGIVFKAERKGEGVMNGGAMFYVEIVEDETGKVERRMGPMSERRAERVADGASINLDHERFSVRTVPADGGGRK